MLTNNPFLTIPERPHEPRRDRLRRRIWASAVLRALRDGPGVSLVELVAAIAELIAPRFPGVHAVLVATLLTRLGLHLLCRRFSRSHC